MAAPPVDRAPADTGRGTGFYFTGGTVPLNYTYVVRAADTELFGALREGHLCYVLNTRQIGKSSLMVRTVQRLREQGGAVAVLDLTGIGQNLTPEQWYDGLLVSLGEQLGCDEALEDFWLDHPGLGPMQRFFEAIVRVALPRVQGALTLFIDEVDAVRSLPFSANEFFAGIRECHNRRTTDPVYTRLTFCLLGVATPADLITDTRISPFNVGRRIVLSDFSEAEAALLAQGLGSVTLLSRILYWTGGHPYLTQRLCRAVAEAGSGAEVDAVCQTLFLSKTARDIDDNLAFVRNRLLRSEVDLAGLLELYRQVHAGRRVADDETNPLCAVLRLSGVVRVENGLLRVRNRIYEQVFNQEWIVAHMPDAELRRQRAAYRRGVLRTALVSSVIVAAMAALAAVAVNNAEQARLAEARVRRNAEQAQRAEAKARAEAGRANRGEAEARRNARQARTAEATARAQAARANRGEAEARRQAGRAIAAQRAAEMARREEKKQRVAAQQAGTLARAQAARANREANRAQRLHYAMGIGSIQRETEASRFESARGLLEQLRDSPVRGFEWEYLDRLCPMLARFHPGTNAETRSLAYSPDGRFFVTGTDDRIPRLWDASHPERPLRTLGKHESGLASIAVSPDSRWIATASFTPQVQLWEASTGRRLRVLQERDKSMLGVAFSPDGRYLLSWGAETLIWEVATGKLLPWRQPGASAAAFSADGAQVIYSLWPANGQSVVRVVDVQTGKTLRSMASWNRGTIWAIAASRDGRSLAIGGGEDEKYGEAQIRDAQTLELVSRFAQHSRPVISLRFTQDGQRVLSAGWDNKTFLWEASSGAAVQSLEGRPATFSPDERTVLLGSWTGLVRMWRMAPQAPYLALACQSGPIPTVAFSPDGRRFATAGAGEDRTAKLWETETGRLLQTLGGHGRGVGVVAFSPDGHLVATSSFGGDVHLWETETGKERWGEKGHAQGILTLRFSPDGRWIATGSNDGEVRLWEVATGRSRLFPAFGGHWGVCAVGFSADSRRLMTCSFDRLVLAIDIASGRRAPLLGRDVRVDALKTAWFSGDGRSLLVATVDKQIRVWDLETRRVATTLTGSAGEIYAVRMSADGQRVAAVGEEGVARLWDPQVGRETLTLPGHTGVLSIQFSPDGHRLITGARDGTVRVWDPRRDAAGKVY